MKTLILVVVGFAAFVMLACGTDGAVLSGQDSRELRACVENRLDQAGYTACQGAK